MAEFLDPYRGMAPARKMTDTELTRALRLDLSAEMEAIHLYQAHADATNNELVRKVLLDIADEERVHAGEFQRLIKILLQDEEELLAEGAQEVNDMADETGNADMNPSGRQIPTIGNLKPSNDGEVVNV